MRGVDVGLSGFSPRHRIAGPQEGMRMDPVESTPVRRCASRHSGPRDGEECGARARFEISCHARPALVVCPQHLGPALLLADGVRWPPEIRLVR